VRRLSLLAVTIAWLAASCRSPVSDGVVEWRFAIEEIAGSVQDAYARAFADAVARRSDGRVRVVVHPYGTIGSSDQLTELAQMGAIELAMASPGHLGTLIPETQVLLLHFLFSDDAEETRAVLAEGGELHRALAPLYREKDLELLSFLVEGWQAWTTRKPIRRPEDFAGQKIRVMTSPLLVAAYEAYGANPVPLPYGEVYGALQLGMIDGQVNPVFAIEEMSFFEVTEVMTLARHAPFVASGIASRRFVERLDADGRAMLRAATAEAADVAFVAQRRLNEERLARILERKPGYRIVELSEEERERFRRASLPVRERYVALVGERGARILDVALRAVAGASRQASGAAPATHAALSRPRSGRRRPRRGPPCPRPAG
jgi:TRAP-type C4-dicarboxylate transport system substrate-binding protein